MPGFFWGMVQKSLSKIVGDIQLDQKLLLGGDILCFDVRGKES